MWCFWCIVRRIPKLCHQESQGMLFDATASTRLYLHGLQFLTFYSGGFSIHLLQEWELQGKEVVAEMSAKYLPPLLEDADEEGSMEPSNHVDVMDVSLADCADADARHQRRSDAMQFSAGVLLEDTEVL